MSRIPVREDTWQTTVTDLAETYGWLRVHFRPARTNSGYRTPVQYEGKGFPDLILVRERVVFAELKGSRGRLSDEQRDWIDALLAAGQETYVWGPDDFDEVNETLHRRRR